MTGRRLAEAAVRHAAWVLAPIRPMQARAMRAEVEHIGDDGPALAWALGCLVAAYRQRTSLVTIGVAGARAAIALAAAGFGYGHIDIGMRNLILKAQLMAGIVSIPPSGPRAVYLGILDAEPLGHWAWAALIFGIVGGLHILAAGLLALGRGARLRIVLAALVVLTTTSHLTGGGGLTLPVIYAALLLMMGGTGAVLDRLWAGERKRLAASDP